MLLKGYRVTAEMMKKLWKGIVVMVANTVNVLNATESYT